MTWEQFLTPGYVESPRRRPMGELVAELAAKHGQPNFPCRRIGTDGRPGEILRVYGGIPL
jgi:hypothetical protein